MCATDDAQRSNDLPPSDNENDLLERFAQLGVRVQQHFTRACATVRVIEMGYEIYGHNPAPDVIVPYIRKRVYAGIDTEPALHDHVQQCRECRRLLRRHAIRRAIYARLDLEIPDWSC